MSERPSELVTREDLRLKLWPEGTFVDFDHGLNTVINKLRELLGDNAANPRFIETLARRGYRFIAPVEFIAGEAPAKESRGPELPHASDEFADSVSESLTKSFLTTADEVPSADRRNVRIFFLLLQIMYLVFYVVALGRLGHIESLLEQFSYGRWATMLLISTASAGIPVRLYLISSIAFDLPDLTRKFSKLFVPILILDGIWSVAPFLLIPQIGMGLALATTAALIYAPFAQRTLLLIAEGVTAT